MQFQHSRNTLLNPSANDGPNWPFLNSGNVEQLGDGIIPNAMESNGQQQKVAYTRVPLQQVEEEIEIYEWRKTESANIIPVLSCRTLSSGSIFNPNPLLKLTLPQYKTQLSDTGKLCIGQCLSLGKQILGGAKMLFCRFGFRRITQRMIVFDDKGDVKVWVCENHHLNPDNELADEQNQLVPEAEALAAIIDILKKKCLENKLSKDLFNSLEKQPSLQKMQLTMAQYEEEKKILVPKQILSTNSKLGSVFGFSSIKLKSNGDSEDECNKNPFGFSGSLSKNLLESSRKIATNSEKEKTIPTTQEKNQANVKHSNTTKANSEFLSINNPEGPPSLEKMFKVSGISQFNSNQPHQAGISTPQLVSPLSPKKLSLKSCVFSEKIQSMAQQFQDSSKEKESVISDDQVNISHEILAKNGWAKNILSLPLDTNTNLKESINCGKVEEERRDGKHFQLKKLHTMGNLTESFLPVEEEVWEQL